MQKGQVAHQEGVAGKILPVGTTMKDMYFMIPEVQGVQRGGAMLLYNASKTKTLKERRGMRIEQTLRTVWLLTPGVARRRPVLTYSK
jgi:hypothetical protein